MHGHVGRVTFKISGDDEVKMVLWDLLVLSKYTGTGVRTSSGFGHCSISSWT
jgi:CRISPR/Cas system endoribonuclease Cas6 (RAMP superfamily)